MLDGLATDMTEPRINRRAGEPVQPAELVADLPRTENGKVQKFRLRERGVTAATWDREAKDR